MPQQKTLRLTYPQWQGGVNPNYVFGADLIAAIAPSSTTDEYITIEVNKDFDAPFQSVDGVDLGGALLSQMKKARQILENKQPDRLIVFGGDCSVTQVPFDYLSGKYGTKIGILWLDAHPDISSLETTSHLHEMPLANLLGINPGSELTQVAHPLSPDKVFLAGLIEERLRPMDQACKELELRIASPETLANDSGPVLDWIRQEHLTHLAVHWDLDVLSPNDFRSIYPGEPYLDVAAFPAAVGRMKLDEVGRLLTDISSVAEIVGLSITEHLPWDAFRMRKLLPALSIFNS